MSPQWTIGHTECQREDGVRLVPAENGPDYVWRAIRLTPDLLGRSEVEIEDVNVVKAMDAVDELWPLS